jgi:hypothetical protein
MERFVKLIKPIRYWWGTRGSDLGIDAIEIAAINKTVIILIDLSLKT